MRNRVFTCLLLIFTFQFCGKRTQPLVSSKPVYHDLKDTLNWFPLGPFGSPIPDAPAGSPSSHGSGRFMCLNLHPEDDNEILAGHATAGLFRTTDGGADWENIPLPDGISCGVNAIVRFNNKKHLLASTGMDLGPSRQYGYGLIESFDAGKTWQRNAFQLTPSENSTDQTRDIAIIDKKREKRLICITDHQVHISGDGGKTWQSTFRFDGKFRQICIDKKNPANLVIGGSHLLLSRDSGKTWKNITPQVVGAFGGAINPYSLYSATFSEAQSNTLFILAANHKMYFLKSVLEESQTEAYQLLGIDQMLYSHNKIQIETGLDKSGQETIYAGTVKLYKSTNGGYSFSICTQAENAHPAHVHDNINHLQIHKNLVYLCTDGGIDRSEPGSCRWRSLTDGSPTLNASLINGFDLYNRNYLMAGTQDMGVFFLRNRVWHCLNNCGDGGRMACLNDSLSFALGLSKRIYQTRKDMTLSHLPADPNVTVPDFRILWNKTNQRIYYADQQLYALNEQNYSELLTHDAANTEYIKAVFIHPDNPLNIWIGREKPYFNGDAGQKFIHSNDGGLTWIDYTSKLPVLKWRGITDIFYSKTGELAVALEAFDKNDKELNKVYISYNGGNYFMNVSTGLPNLPVNCLLNINKTWYCGTNDGVYWLKNRNWMRCGSNFPRVIVTELKYSSSDKCIYASTLGRGMWRLSRN